MKETNTPPLLLTCNKCLKPNDLCFCSEIKPLSFGLKVLILQHPQEPDKLLGTAKIANLTLQNSKLKVGLSWPNLSKAWGEETKNAEWGVLYIRGKNAQASKKPEPIISDLKGIVVLDGTWAQAKTLWWRNPWLLKLKRIHLEPQHRSLYGNLRREPRKECLSTLEAIAAVIDQHAIKPQTQESAKKITQTMLAHFSTLLNKYKNSQNKNKLIQNEKKQDQV